VKCAEKMGRRFVCVAVIGLLLCLSTSALTQPSVARNEVNMSVVRLSGARRRGRIRCDSG